MTKKRTLTPEEQRLWRALADQVTPLHGVREEAPPLEENAPPPRAKPPVLPAAPAAKKTAPLVLDAVSAFFARIVQDEMKAASASA